MGFLIIVAGSVLGAYLDIYKKIKEPTIFYCLGLGTGFLSGMLIMYSILKG